MHPNPNHSTEVRNIRNRSGFEENKAFFLVTEWRRSQDFTRKPEQELGYNLRYRIFVNATTIFVVFIASLSQHGSNRTWSSTCLLKQDQ